MKNTKNQLALKATKLITFNFEFLVEFCVLCLMARESFVG